MTDRVGILITRVGAVCLTATMTSMCKNNLKLQLIKHAEGSLCGGPGYCSIFPDRMSSVHIWYINLSVMFNLIWKTALMQLWNFVYQHMISCLQKWKRMSHVDWKSPTSQLLAPTISLHVSSDYSNNYNKRALLLTVLWNRTHHSLTHKQHQTSLFLPPCCDEWRLQTADHNTTR